MATKTATKIETPTKKYILVDKTNDAPYKAGTLEEIMQELEDDGVYTTEDASDFILYELTKPLSIEITKPQIIIK